MPACTTRPLNTLRWPFTSWPRTGGKVAVEGAYGMAVPELDVPLKPYHIAPIGSNSKLFTAGARRRRVHARGGAQPRGPTTRTEATGRPARTRLLCCFAACRRQGPPAQKPTRI